ncbi:MAG: PAS domain S-box protein, partial [Gammaproteobacteria bacterium SHHR-1]
MTINLINNISFLIALAAAGQVVVLRLPENTLNRQVLLGLLFGGAALLGMANPVNFAPGVFFDGRSIVLAVAGVVGGGVTAAIAAGMAAFYRYQLGGIGAPVGIIIVLLSALFGVLARQWWLRRTKPPRPIDYLALGVVVQLMQLAAFTQVPNRAGYAFIEQAWWVLLLFYPLTTMLLCLIFRNVEQQLIDKAALQSARDALVAEERASLQRFRAYFEHSSIGFAITSAEKGWLEVNDALCAALGYSRDELTRLTWAELTCPADLPADQMQFDRMLAGEINSYDIDKRFIHKEGHLVETHLAASLVRKPDGGVDYVVAVVEDLSERKQAQRSLAESEARFEGIFEQAAVGIALVATDGRWLRVNGRLCSIVGYTQEELLAKTFQDITHPDDLDADLDQVRRMCAREIDNYSLEKRYYRKNGGIVWINLTVSMVRKNDGTPDYFISVVEDISARKAVEQSLAEQVEEMSRWQAAMLGREARIISIKQEVNELLAQSGQPPRYGVQLPTDRVPGVGQI